MTQEDINEILSKMGYDKYLEDVQEKAAAFHAEMALLKKKDQPKNEDFIPAKSAWALFMQSFLNVVYHADHLPSLNWTDINDALEVSKYMRQVAFQLQTSIVEQYMIN